MTGNLRGIWKHSSNLERHSLESQNTTRTESGERCQMQKEGNGSELATLVLSESTRTFHSHVYEIKQGRQETGMAE